MRIKLILLLFLFTALPLAARPPLVVPEESLQLVTVVSENWDSPTALLKRYERPGHTSKWTQVGPPVTVNLGRTGLAWGSSFLMDDGPPKKPGESVKKEGDGKSPAGIFPFLKAFGHPHPPSKYGEENLPFTVITDQQCVDDGRSDYYNQVLSPESVGGVSWNSAETMKIPLYALGLVVGHNCPDAQPGMGSCIFFHLERGPGRATAGCTSMRRSPLEELVLWLKWSAKPVVIQLPQPVFQEYRTSLFPKD